MTDDQRDTVDEFGALPHCRGAGPEEEGYDCMIRTTLLAILALFVGVTSSCYGSEAPRPNILWLFQEDTSPWMGCYGHKINRGWTPTIDGMAERGVIFKRAYVPAPVCSPCRSAVIVGANQVRFGAHEHRSGRKTPIYLPEGMKMIPQLMAEAGYFTFNVGKTDYNFSTRPGSTPPYSKISKGNSKTPWRERGHDQPFFGQIQLKGGKLNTSKFPKEKKVDRASVTIPADYPQNDLYREVVAEHHDSIRMDDGIIGGILARLREDNLLDTTIVVYVSDHGANNLVRHKQQPTEAGLHVPFVVTGPERWVPAGVVRDDLVSVLDLSATTLAWAGLPLPEWCEGRDLFAEGFTPRTFVGGARDRCDHTVERIRSIRTENFRYTRNYLLDRVLLQPQYRDRRDFLVHLRHAYAAGTLAPKLAEIYFGERPPEELYDMRTDPAQVNNLVDDPAHKSVLKQHRRIMDEWLSKGDMGQGKEPDHEIRQSSAHWGRGVNPEHERVRTDSDGDGLSDEWEKLNGRDPADGRLLFTFDCGGWQTEGWQTEGRLTNIAGRQGFLDFDLLQGRGAIVREGLDLKAAKNTGALVVRIKTSGDAQMSLAANTMPFGETTVEAGAFRTVRFPLEGKPWSGIVERLRLGFLAPKGTTIEIDWIRVE